MRLKDNKGCQHEKKRFTVMGGGDDFKIHNVMTEADKERFSESPKDFKPAQVIVKRKKKVIPFGDRILVKRRQVGEKIGAAGVIIAPGKVEESLTELADIIHIPDHSFADTKLIENGDKIIDSHISKAEQGDSDALIALLRFRDYLKIKSLRVGDAVMISKYIGVNFHDNEGGADLTLVNAEDIIGRVVEV